MRSRKRLQPLIAEVSPGSALFKVADEHLIGTQGISAVLLDDVVRVDHIASGLAHLLAVLAQDHAVAGALLVRLRAVDTTPMVIQELVPEPAVQQVQGGMLHTAVVPVYGHPVFQRLLGGKFLVVVRIRSTAGSTRRNRPTGAWYPSPAWPGAPQTGQVVFTQSVMAARGLSPVSVGS